MADGGGARATVELLLHFHGFKNIDLRSRGLFCIEVVVCPVSSPRTPGVPFRTFCDPSARRSAARGVIVHPVKGEKDRRSRTGTSKGGLPSYSTSLLPIRFTNEQVQLNEGCLFRVHIDADWLETDVIAIEFRLLYRELPDSNNAATEGGQSSGEISVETLKEAGKLTLHAKCASAKGGLHRYHPLIFPQPYLCLLDVTLHMALISIGHPGGPASIAAAIAANAFPSEESGGAPAPRRTESPSRRGSSPIATPNRVRGRSLSTGRSAENNSNTLTPTRPRFMTPGRTRKSAFVAHNRSSSFGGVGGSALFSSTPLVRAQRYPLSTAALEAAAGAAGLASALGYAPAKLDSDVWRRAPAREVYRAAELLYSRHALGLRWSKGTLEEAKTAAEKSADTENALGLKRRAKLKSKKAAAANGDSGGSGGKAEAKGEKSSKEVAVVNDSPAAGQTDASMKALVTPFFGVRAVKKDPYFAVATTDTTTIMTAGQPQVNEMGGQGVSAACDNEGGAFTNPGVTPFSLLENGRRGGVENGGNEPPPPASLNNCSVGGDNGGGRQKEVRPSGKSAVLDNRHQAIATAEAKAESESGSGGDVALPPSVSRSSSSRKTVAVEVVVAAQLVSSSDGDARTEVPSEATPTSDIDGDSSEMPPCFQPITPAEPRRGRRASRGDGDGNGGASQKVGEAVGKTKREGKEGRSSSGKKRGKGQKISWTWGASPSKVKVDTSKTPLPSDLRQLSRAIHWWLDQESSVCSRAWSAFAKATFECGRRGLLGLREEWVRDTTRAWSGQCLENMLEDRANLLLLNEALLHTDGFLSLRAKAGIRLKRRASPTGGTTASSSEIDERRIGSSNNPSSSRVHRRQRNKIQTRAFSNVSGDGATNSTATAIDIALPKGMARLKALNRAVSNTWSDASVSGKNRPYGRAHSTASAANSEDFWSVDSESTDDENAPPLLYPLVRRRKTRKKEKSKGTEGSFSSALLAGEEGVLTPKEQPTGSGWGTVSPWTTSKAPSSSVSVPETTWLSRFAAGSGVGAPSSPTDSTASVKTWGAVATGSLLRPGVVMDFPPPPQSLLSVFDRELHGFDVSAPEDDRWGELPFLMVESWGGLGEDEEEEDEFEFEDEAPCSPMLASYNLFFNRVPFSSTTRKQQQQQSPSKKPRPRLSLLNGDTATTAADTNGNAAAVNGVNSSANRKNNTTAGASSSFSYPNGNVVISKPKTVSSDAPLSATAAATAIMTAVASPVIIPPAGPGANGERPKTPPPPYTDLFPPATPVLILPFNALPHRSSATAATTVVANFPPASASNSHSNSNGTTAAAKKQQESEEATDKKSIWDQPVNPRQRRQGPKYYAERRRTRPPTRAPSLPQQFTAAHLGDDDAGLGNSSSSSQKGGIKCHRRNKSAGVALTVGRGGNAGASVQSSSDELWSGSDKCLDSDSSNNINTKNNNYNGKTGEDGGGIGGCDSKRRSRRDEIQRRMWGKRPSWTAALLATPTASSTAGSSGAAAPPPQPQESGTNHLVVLVHGLGGRPADMALMRGYLQALMPGAEMMVATSLQDMRKENLGVEEMGRKLAEEVHTHITRFCPYLGRSSATAAPTSTRSKGADSSGIGSLPLSPVTPLRPARNGANRISTLSPPGRSGAFHGGGVFQSPGSAATVRAVAQELIGEGGSVGGSKNTTPSRRRSGGRRVSGGGDSGVMESAGGMLSFVCFSMGGLVVRSALLESAMLPYLSSLQCYVTLACPHLGQTSTPLSFFKTGAWAVRKLTGLRVLHELDLDDADDPRQTTLYQLCSAPGLERFRTIIFAANPRDGFVPLHSATVRNPPGVVDSNNSSSNNNSTATTATKKSTTSTGVNSSSSSTKAVAISAEMAGTLMSHVDERYNRVIRMTLDAPRSRQAQGPLDSVIGRAGHMCFIDSAQVAWLISLALLPFMEEIIS